MTKDQYRERSCTRKISYSSRSVAKRAMKELGRFRVQEAYTCEFCGLWHIGHKSQKRESPPPVLSEIMAI